MLTEREDSLREQLLCSHKEGIRLQFLLDQTTMELERLRVSDRPRIRSGVMHLSTMLFSLE